MSLCIILPKQCLQHETQIIDLLHPRTGMKCKFVKSNSQLYELTSVDGQLPHSKPEALERAFNQARSIIYSHGYVKNDAKILVATPINPIFFALSILSSKGRSRYITMENIEDYMELSYSEQGLNIRDFPFTALEENKRLDQICDSKVVSTGDTAYQLSDDKLVKYLTKLKQRSITKSPEILIKKYVNELIAPIDLNSEAPSDIRQTALNRLAMTLICTYLPVDLEQIFMKSLPTVEFDKYLEKLESQRAAAKALAERNSNLQINGKPKKQAPAKPNGKALKRKSIDTQSMKITDMFRVKAKSA